MESSTTSIIHSDGDSNNDDPTMGETSGNNDIEMAVLGDLHTRINTSGDQTSGTTHPESQDSCDDTQPTKTISAVSGQDVNILQNSSDTSVICRICHMSHKETGEEIGCTDCECRGGLESVHRSCLIQWVTYKRNNRCELCGVIFPAVSPPHRSNSTERQRRRIEAVYQQYTQLRPMTRRKRAFLGSISLFLGITTSATGILTVSTEREFQRIHDDPWASGQERMDSYVSFSICLSFLLFCATLTVGVLLIWLALEGGYYRRRERFYTFAQRIARQDGLESPTNTA